MNNGKYKSANWMGPRSPLIDRVQAVASQEPAKSPGGLPYVNPGDDQFAQKTMANIHRAEWEDYKARFMPYERKLKDMVGNKAEQEKLEGLVRQNVGRSYGLADTQFRDRQRQYGTAPTALQQQVQDNSMSLSRAAAETGAVNSLRDHLKDRDNMILAGGLGDVLVSNDV